MRYQFPNLIAALLLAVSVGVLAPSHVVWHPAHGHGSETTATTDSCSGHGHAHASMFGGSSLPDPGDQPQPASSHDSECHLCLIMLTLLVIAAFAWRDRLPLKSFSSFSPLTAQPVLATVGVIRRRGPPA